jgi:pyrroline-5-carboxylate reductase
MDVGTAIAGSGPGLVFRLIDAMAQVGVREGLSHEKSLSMAAQVFMGAARLILEGASPADLVRQIATPQGTTEAAFRVLESRNVESCLQEAIGASIRRDCPISVKGYHT